jgi:phospholipase/carboxylesterase
VTSEDLKYRTREPDGPTEGALVLIHGRGADENDLFPLFDALDPDRRVLGVSPRGPLSLPPGGAHWYAVRQVGYPDPDTFFPTFERLSGWLDAFLAEHEIRIERTVLGGFSQGTVMSYALALGKGRPRPAGVLAFSGFIPQVEGFDLATPDLEGFPVAIGHGIYDPVISVEFGRDARRQLEEAGADVVYRESPIPHGIDPGFIETLKPWLARLP